MLLKFDPGVYERNQQVLYLLFFFGRKFGVYQTLSNVFGELVMRVIRVFLRRQTLVTKM